MAGDWIKMRSDLHTHPKVVRIASALKADKLRAIGGLHAVWCLFDAHSIDGNLDGYSVEILDAHLGWDGFSAEMIRVGWLEENEHGLNTPRFDEHNGQSAKRRAQETERKRTVRKVSAPDADKKRTREEKRREDIKPTSQPGTDGQVPEKFQMHIGWQPSGHIADLAKQANVTIKPEKLPEFIAHWLTQMAQRTQSEWDKALLQSAMHDRNRDAGKPEACSKQSCKPEKFDPVAFVNSGQSKAEGDHGRVIEHAA